MNQEDITRMAREAGFEELFKDSHDWVCFTEEIERFAALVAAAEREAILQISCDQWFKTQADFEEAIRARGETK